jgi:type 1 glutamine amidotransferase
MRKILLGLSVLVCGLTALMWGGRVRAEKKAPPPPRPAAAAKKKVVFLAGRPSHGRDTHAWDADARLLKYCLDQSPLAAGLVSEIHLNGWPKDPKTLDDAATIVLLADGFKGHPLFQTPQRTRRMEKLLGRGVGLVCLHYAVAPLGPPAEAALLKWIGGIYKSGYSKNPIHTASVAPAAASHPICRGWTGYTVKDELYYRIFLGQGPPDVTAILTAQLPPKEPKPETVAWCVERKDGGRGFGFTGGHFHNNYRLDAFRTMVLNAIVWTARLDVPEGGVKSALPKRSFLTPKKK